MALKATIYKAELQVSDMDRGYYASHSLVLALHPSETEERMMLRVLAFALNASDELRFGKGISSEEPDLWRHDLTGQVEHWIEIGQPDEQLLRRASGRAREVTVYQNATRGAAVWWEKNAAALRRIHNLKLFQVPAATCDALAQLANRNMQLQCLVQEGVLQVMSDEDSVEIELHQLVPAAGNAPAFKSRLAH
jgi:uncharacterized protein YaeQ